MADFRFPRAARSPRWHVHVTLANGSYSNQVERFVADLTEKRIRRGGHRSAGEPERAVTTCSVTVNEAAETVPLAQDCR